MNAKHFQFLRKVIQTNVVFLRTGRYPSAGRRLRTSGLI